MGSIAGLQIPFYKTLPLLQKESGFLLTEASKYNLEDVLNKLCAKVIFQLGPVCTYFPHFTTSSPPTFP